MYKQFAAWNCSGSSVAPIIDYMNNPIFQELPDEDTYFSTKNDDRVYLHLRASSGYVKEAKKLERSDSKINLQITLKTAARYKLRVRIWAYSISEYLYVLSKSGLTLKHRTYAINQSDEDFLEWVEENSLQKKGFWYIGGRKRKQRGGAIPIGLLASIGNPILCEIAKPILGKILCRGRRRKRRFQKRRRKWEKKIVLRRRTSPKIVTLPNGTTFTARYERISRKNY